MGKKPDNHLSVSAAVVIIVGVVIGAGIFKTPSIVAASAGGAWPALLLWAAGGLISLVGALCYAELASAYPDAGGDYHYLHRAYGRAPAFLFAWARLSVIQSGSIAMLSFLVGDYLAQVFGTASSSSAVYAAFTVVLMTAVNMTGTRYGSGVQKTLMGALALGLAGVVAAGFSAAPGGELAPGAGSLGTPGKALIFVLLTYGGWNEAAYLSSEVRGSRLGMVWVLLLSIGIITAVYLAVNLAFIYGLGFPAVAGSSAVAADLMRKTQGENGARLISLLVALSALSTINGMVITGARTNYAFGRDFAVFRFLGKWKDEGGTPAHALLVQGAVALVLVAFGAMARDGFTAMVEYTAPVFWFFFLLAGISLFVLRWKESGAARPFRVPLYPVTPALFCAVSAYMLASSLSFTGKGALVGIGVLAAGLPLLLVEGPRRRRREGGER